MPHWSRLGRSPDPLTKFRGSSRKRDKKGTKKRIRKMEEKGKEVGEPAPKAQGT